MPIPAEYDNVPTNFEPIKIGKEPPRSRDPIWICVDPDGKEYEVAQHNIRDWERRGEGWVVKGKKQPKAKVKVETAVVEATTVSEPDSVVLETLPRDEAPDVLTPLNALRAQASDLGIEWKQNWGLKRLTKEIESVTPGQE